MSFKKLLMRLIGKDIIMELKVEKLGLTTPYYTWSTTANDSSSLTIGADTQITSDSITINATNPYANICLGDDYK